MHDVRGAFLDITNAYQPLGKNLHFRLHCVAGSGLSHQPSRAEASAPCSWTLLLLKGHI